MKNTPYWWTALAEKTNTEKPLPIKADVVIVGAGITGLNAALTLVKANRNVLLMDANQAGYGASTRNAGFLSKAHLHSLSTLIQKYGEDKAIPLVEEACKAFDFTQALIEREKIDCHYNPSGRIYWAYTHQQGKKLHTEHQALAKHFSRLNINANLTGSSAQSLDIHSAQYHQGLHVKDSSTLHPGLYTQGLEQRVCENGAELACNTKVKSIEKKASGFTVKTSRGDVQANQVIVATNAYVGEETPYFRQRVVPVVGQMIAIKPNDPAMLEKLLPNHIAHLDVRAMFRFWRRSPDNTHILFGSRTGFAAPNPNKAAAQLKGLLVDIFPQLAQSPVSHYWKGLLGGTMDQFPHLGCHNGIYYATGMNGHGVPMGTYLGDNIAKKLMREHDTATQFDDLSFKAAPLIKGKSWFMPLICGAQKVAEKMEKPVS